MNAKRGTYPMQVTPAGHVLWRDHIDAVRYAQVRHMLYGTRQRVTGEPVLGVWFWRVTRAQPKVAEPCS